MNYDGAPPSPDRRKQPTWTLVWVLAGLILAFQQVEILEIKRDLAAEKAWNAVLDSRQWAMDRRQDHLEGELSTGITEMKRSTGGLIQALRNYLGQGDDYDRNRETNSGNPSPRGGATAVHRP